MAALGQYIAGIPELPIMININIDRKMKYIINELLVFLILIGCTTPYQGASLGDGYSDTQKYNPKATSRHHIETSTGEKIKIARREQDILDQAGRLRSFLFLYCRAYESKNLDKFSAFFAPDATENNKAFNEFLPRYRRNFERIESFNDRDLTPKNWSSF